MQSCLQDHDIFDVTYVVVVKIQSASDLWEVSVYCGPYRRNLMLLGIIAESSERKREDMRAL